MIYDMDWMMLLYVLPSLVTGFAGFFVGKSARRKQRNDILQEMQNSIDRLVVANSKLLEEVVASRGENCDMKSAIKRLSSENAELKAEISRLVSVEELLRVEVAEVKKQNAKLLLEVAQLTIEDKKLRIEVEKLKFKL